MTPTKIDLALSSRTFSPEQLKLPGIQHSAIETLLMIACRGTVQSEFARPDAYKVVAENIIVSKSLVPALKTYLGIPLTEFDSL